MAGCSEAGAQTLGGNPPARSVRTMTADKWETLRRLRYGALVRLFRDRYGYVLPDDDSGRSDLWELVTNVSLAKTPEKKMAFVIEIWAPWMKSEEATELIDHVKRLSIHDRTPTARQLGERLRLSNVNRVRLKLWPIKPFDTTDGEVAAQSRARRNVRRRAKRSQSRVQYLAGCLSQQRPWEAEGIHRRTWERRRAKERAASVVTTIVSKAETQHATPAVVESQRGRADARCKEFSVGEVVGLRIATKTRAAERTASGSPSLSPYLRQREQRAAAFTVLASELSAVEPRMAWGALICSVALASSESGDLSA